MRKTWKKLGAASAAIFAVVFSSCGHELPNGGVTEPKAARSQALQVSGLRAEYFDDDALQVLVTTRIDPQVDFFWGSGTPSGTSLSSADSFSVRWSGALTAPATGLYTFTTSTDDGVRLWIGGQNVIDNWTLEDDNDPLSVGTTSLVAGQTYLIVMEYFEGPGLAHAKLSWAYPGQAQQIIPAAAFSHDDGPSVPGVPPLVNTGTPTDFEDAISFLYEGTNPPQTGVVPGTMDSRRVAVAYGRVFTTAGAPLPGVKVTVLSHPEWGETLTRADGSYEFALNGGGHVVMQFEKDGLLPVQRTIQTPWREWVSVDDVALTALDTAVTVVSTSAPTLQVARGNPVTDVDGTRQATLLVPAGTAATMTLPGGGVQSLSTMSVRATEYTVGEGGPRAMPGTLPPMIAYTYALEWSLDEALAVGATQVSFSQPVFFYLDNFLNFPVGGAVPTGYYDRQVGQWKADADGRVIKIVSISNGIAEVDVTGDGMADTGAPLNALGFTLEELQRLAILYTAGTSLWRVPLTHLTPWDCNWPFGFPDGAEAPPNEEPEADAPEPNSCKVSGSIIECENQTLGEVVSITGTPYSLYYQSDRVPGRTSRYSFVIPVTGATVPDSAKYAIVKITGAGRTWRYQFGRTPNRKFTFQWDGLDRWGRMPQGTQTFLVEVGYAYQGVYRDPRSGGRSFGSSGGAAFATGNRQTLELVLWRRWTKHLVAHNTLAQALGGWTLNAHHTFEPKSGLLYRGDGARQTSKATGAVLQYVAGRGTTFTEGGLAATSSFGLHHLAPGPDGSLYALDMTGGLVRRITPDGYIHTIVGCRTGCAVSDGSAGALATETNFGAIQAHALGPDGSHYVAARSRVYRIAPDGIVHIFAGDGTTSFDGTNGEGGPAVLAKIGYVTFLGVTRDGDVYFSTGANSVDSARRIRKVDSAGIITTVVGNGTRGGVAADVPALETGLNQVTLSAGFDAAGSLYFGGSTEYRIRKLDADGIVRNVVGNATYGYSGEDGPAVNAGMAGSLHNGGMALGPDGSLYFTDQYRVRRVGPDGVVSTVAGVGTVAPGDPSSGANAFQTSIRPPHSIAVDGNGALYIGFVQPFTIYKVVTPYAGLAVGEVLVPAEDGREAYVFAGGRHLRTVNALTGATLLTFGYDPVGRLVTLTDANAQVTTIERQPDGRPTAVVAPGGQRTELLVSSEGLLSRVENPNSEAIALEYGKGGLLTSLTDARNGLHIFEYDSAGRLVKDTNPGGGFKALARSKPASGHGSGKGGYAVAVTTAEGRVTRHTSEKVGSLQRRTTLSSAGGLTQSNVGSNASTSTIYPNGTTESIRYGNDPRFGMSAPFVASHTTTLPSGLTRVETASHVVARPTGANVDNPFDYSSATWTSSLNGKTSSTVFSKASGRFTRTSPMNKKAYVDVDAQGRVTRIEVSGIEPTTFAYYSDGQLAAVEQGARSRTFNYYSSGPASGWLESTTDSMSQTVGFLRDSAGRVMSATLPDLHTVLFGFDAEGNLTSIVPPGRTAHYFGYTANGMEESYVPPMSAGTGTLGTLASYNSDDELAFVEFPDGDYFSFGYDAGGRPVSLVTPRHSVVVGYSGLTGLIDQVVDSAAAGGDGASLSFGYDGDLVRSVAWSGGVSGSVSYGYDSNFDMASIRVNDGTPVVYVYDSDRLLKSAGSLFVSRNSLNGLLTGTTLGNVSTVQMYNSYGDVASHGAKYGATTLYSESLVQDSAGRIVSRAETVLGGGVRNWGYTYDAAGRLESVRLNGLAHAVYLYDANGNRISQTEGGGVTTAVYDGQDRMVSRGGASYTYGPRGDLQAKVDGLEMTNYVYDVAGNLVAVSLPGGVEIEYVIDASDRRVGKRIAGDLVQGFLYDGQLRVVAELDGAGVVVSEFVYASRRHVPDYMVREGVAYRIVSDYLGSPRVVVNSVDGSVVQSIDYDVWGNVLSDSNPGFQPFGFAGGVYDGDTGLIRFGARDYEPRSGRWTTKDPVGFGGGDFNLYVYCVNLPTMYVDPAGLAPVLTPYNTMEEAVMAGFSWIESKTSDYNSAEYQFYVYRRAKDQTWRYSTPAKGVDGDSGHAKAQVPKHASAYCHSHRNKDGPGFSTQDKDQFVGVLSKIPGIRFYLLDSRRQVIYAVEEADFPGGRTLKRFHVDP